jgi:hypothetical protein
MATERQIKANRANAAKSTGPVTPEGKRISSQNASLHRLLSDAAVPEGASLRRYNQFAAALMLQFQPRDADETALIHSMALARWHRSTLWGMQTATLRREMRRARQHHSDSDPLAAESGAPRAAAFRSLAENSRAFLRQHRLEIYYGRQFNQALAKLLKLREPRILKPKPILTPSRPDFSGGSDS